MRKAEREKFAAMVGKQVWRDDGSGPIKLIGFDAGYFIGRFKRAMPFIIYPKEIGHEFVFSKPEPEIDGVTCPKCGGECNVPCD